MLLFRLRRLHVDDKRTEQLNIRLSPQEVRLLRAAAEEKGVGAATLLRLWMREKLASSFREARLRATATDAAE